MGQQEHRMGDTSGRVVYVLTTGPDGIEGPDCWHFDGVFSSEEAALDEVSRWSDKGLYSDGSRRYDVNPWRVDDPEWKAISMGQSAAPPIGLVGAFCPVCGERVRASDPLVQQGNVRWHLSCTTVRLAPPKPPVGADDEDTPRGQNIRSGEE